MIGENIKKIREAYGYSQEEFAAKLGTTRSVIANLEYSKLQSPEKKMPLFRLISEKFGVPVEWIISDAPGPLPPLPTEQSKHDFSAGRMVDDPVVRRFMEFWSERTDEEKAVLQKAIDAFADALRQPSEQ